eukprot:superscaffoldBa00002843_g15442
MSLAASRDIPTQKVVLTPTGGGADKTSLWMVRGGPLCHGGEHSLPSVVFDALPSRSTEDGCFG